MGEGDRGREGGERMKHTQEEGKRHIWLPIDINTSLHRYTDHKKGMTYNTTHFIVFQLVRPPTSQILEPADHNELIHFPLCSFVRIVL